MRSLARARTGAFVQMTVKLNSGSAGERAVQTTMHVFASAVGLLAQIPRLLGQVGKSQQKLTSS
jgi:hypothetical protein